MSRTVGWSTRLAGAALGLVMTMLVSSCAPEPEPTVTEEHAGAASQELWGSQAGAFSGITGLDEGLQPSRTESPHIWDVRFEVELGPARPVTMHAVVHHNPRASSHGATLVGVHGVGHTGSTWSNLTQSIFTSPELKHGVRLFIALDLPGHGPSGLPPTEGLGDLDMADYVVAITESLRVLSAHGASVDAVIGHSLGGLLLQLVQRDLLAQGTSLYEELGVRSAILYASNGPVEVPWAAAVPPPPLLVFMDRDSLTLYFPPPVWQAVFFTNSVGELVAGAPSWAEIGSSYGSVESLTVFDELTLYRPSAPAGILADENGTETAVIAVEQDFILTLDEERALYTYVTGEDPDAPGSTFTAVQSLAAVHDMYISQPEGLIPGLCKVLACE